MALRLVFCRVRRVVVWLALVASVVACAGTAVACWLETSFVGWVTNLGVLAILLLVTVAYDRPGRHLVRAPFALVYPLCGLGGVASVGRITDVDWPHVSSTAMGAVVVTLGETAPAQQGSARITSRRTRPTGARW
jgi:hypothetical protein